MTSDITEKRCERLAEQGYRHLEDGQPEAALKVAAELEALEYTAAFEIAALAHAQRGDLAAAVEELKRGVDREPAVWVNWQLLGNYLSDLDRHEEAAAAYERALGCPGVEVSSIRLNQAVLALRRDAPEQALDHARMVEDPELASRAAAIEVEALIRAGRFDEAVLAGEAALAASEAKVDDPDELAPLAASVGRARWKRGAGPAEVFAFVLESLERYDPTNKDLLRLVRDVDDQHSATAQYHRLLVEARIPFTSPQYQKWRGYVVSYDVRADSLDEALSLVARMEPAELRGNLRIEEQEVLAGPSDDPKGVYARSVRHYYEREQ